MSGNEAQAQAMLMEMGFEEARVKEALAVCNNNAEQAVEYLFSGGTAAAMAADPPPGGTAAAPTYITGTSEDISAPISQYSFDQGRSACTCIAMTAAQKWLIQPDTKSLSPMWIQETLKTGVETYEKLQQTGGQSEAAAAAVEHMSAEEVLAIGQSSQFFSRLQMTPGGIRQGILSKHNSQHEMGILAMLNACHQEAPSDQWLAVLITKTPETILVCLPPKRAAAGNISNNNSQQQYIIIDSHPRPGVVDSNGGAYARILQSMADLVAHLETILPATELGPDIPEMMAMMYNSFDLYPFVLKST